jgi:hypothetical protein
MDWKSVAEKIIQDDQNKWDRTVPSRELRVGESGAVRLNGTNGESFPLSEIAVNQLCGKLEIPVKYFRRLPGEMQAHIANYDLGRQNRKSFLLRDKGEWVRAFLSAEYVAYNNLEIAQTAESLLRNEALSVKSFVLEESHMFLKIISEDIVDHAAGLNHDRQFRSGNGKCFSRAVCFQKTAHERFDRESGEKFTSCAHSPDGVRDDTPNGGGCGRRIRRREFCA